MRRLGYLLTLVGVTEVRLLSQQGPTFDVQGDRDPNTSVLLYVTATHEESLDFDFFELTLQRETVGHLLSSPDSSGVCDHFRLCAFPFIARRLELLLLRRNRERGKIAVAHSNGCGDGGMMCWTKRA